MGSEFGSGTCSSLFVYPELARVEVECLGGHFLLGATLAPVAIDKVSIF